MENNACNTGNTLGACKCCEHDVIKKLIREVNNVLNGGGFGEVNIQFKHGEACLVETKTRKLLKK